MIPFIDRGMEAWRCQIIQLGVTHSGGEEAGLGTGSLSRHLHRPSAPSGPPAASKVVPGEEMGGR